MGLAESEKARTAARQWLKASMKSLDTVVKATADGTRPEDRRGLVESALEEVKHFLVKWEAAQDRVEQDIAMEDLEKDIDDAVVFRADVQTCKEQAARELRRCSAIVEAAAHPHPPASFARLPQLDLPRFGGEVREWTSFWEQFEAAVHKTNLPDVMKFLYLRTLLHGDAARCIEGLNLTAAHYAHAVTLLEERFGRREMIVVSHVDRLLNMKTSDDSTKALRELLDTSQTHVRCLETLSVTKDEYGVFLTPILLSKLPEDLRLEWSRGSESKESDLDFLFEFLKKEIKRRERSSVFAGPSHVLAGRESESTSPLAAAAVPALITQLEQASREDRWKMARKKHLCYGCLSADHLVTECPRRRRRALRSSPAQKTSRPADAPSPVTSLAVPPLSRASPTSMAGCPWVSGRRLQAPCPA